MSTTEGLLQCLVGTMNADAATRHQSEVQLQNFSVEHGFGLALLELLLSDQVDLQVRQLAAVLCRQYIDGHWSRQKAGFVEPEITDEHKIHMRNALLNALTMEHSKLRTAASMAIAAVAKEDFPENWPELIPHILQMLQAGAPHLVHGAMRCLVLVSEEITDNQVPHIITHLFPELFKVFISADVYPKSVRARTCTVIYKCVKLVSLLGDASDSEALSLQLLQQCIPAWLMRYTEILSLPLPADDADELCMRIEILKILTVIIENYPRLLSSCASHIIQSIWQALVNTVEVYEQKVVFSACLDDFVVDPQDDMDGDRLSVETLVFELVECVREVVGCRHTSKLVQPELKPLIFMLIRFMQVTADQLETWSNDVNAYIAHEDEGSFESSIRISAADVVSEICDSFGGEGWQAVLEAVMGQLEAAGQAKSSGQDKWWLRREACMFSVAVMCADADPSYMNVIFRPADFMHQVVLPDMLPGTPPVLRGRALHCVSSFAEWISPETAIHCFEAAMASIGEDSPLPVRMTAARAIASLSVGEASHEFLRPHVSMLLQSIAKLLANATEDSALITLEAMHTILKIDSPDVVQHMPLVLEQVMLALGRCHGDLMIANEAVETIETVSKIPECVHMTAQAATPLIMSVLQNPEKFVGTMVESVLELLSKIIRKGPEAGPYRGALLDTVLPTLLFVMLNSTIEDLLQPGCDCLRSYLRVCRDEVLGLTVAGQPSIECFHAIISRLLSYQASEGCGVAVTPLACQFVLRCREAASHFVVGVLAAAVARLNTANSLSLRQALCVMFARLLNEDLQATLGFLVQHQEEGGERAISILMKHWCKDHLDFCGAYEVKVLTAALGNLLVCGNPGVLNLPVPGSYIVNVDEGRVTRSMSRAAGKASMDQWTQVPLAAKAFELLVQTVSREDRDEDDEGSFDSGGRDSDNSGGDDDDLGGRAEKGLDEVEECSDKRPSGGDVLTGSEVLNHKPPFMGTEQFEARKKEMVKTLMAGIGIARDQDLDDDKLEDPLSRVDLREKSVEILARLAQQHSDIFNSCLQHISPGLKSSAMEYAASHNTARAANTQQS